MKIEWGYDLSNYEGEDNGDPLEESKRLAKKAVHRLNDIKEATDTGDYLDNLTPEREQVFLNILKLYKKMTYEQKKVWIMRINQGFTFGGIGELRGYTKQGAIKHFSLACKKFQKIQSESPAKLV
jgi:hypothetical protein